MFLINLQDLQDNPYIKFDLAAVPAKGGDGPVRLTLQDIDALPGISECIEAVIKILPSEVEPDLILTGGTICIWLVSFSPGKEGAVRAQRAGDQVVDLLDRAADKLRENAQSLAPQPYAGVVPDKSLQTVLRAFAAANEESPLKVFFVHADGREHALPILDTAELPAVLKHVADNLPVNAKIIGLIRGENGSANELIIEGGTHIQLPARAPWEWNDIHLILESPRWIVGTLVRLPRSNRWTVDPDSKVTTQLEMKLVG